MCTPAKASESKKKKEKATTFQCEAEIMSIRTKKSWYYPACGSGKCKKGVTRKDGQLWCYTCNKHVTYRRSRFRFQVDVMDATAQTVIVMWDETALELTKSSAKALLDELDEVEDDAPSLPNALTNLYNTKHVFEVKSYAYYNFGDFESFTCTSVSPSNGPTVS
ncbi:nucleic acid-binding, OB-fold protein [Artemisia annua]|uniref:Nucleic acid-binding, OB-fold protein n=1 Tax=Artemisia annua TaxID=35608 RepID=A0A2U1KE21_ARTAN|nr:nucleic acid-binding, OB-fold protein [Artemisia annua]